jgi:hypothetical protein
MEGLQRERVAQDARKTLASPEVSQPVPGEEAFDPDNEVLPVGSKSLQQRFRPCLPMLVERNLSCVVQHAQVQATSMAVKTTVKRVWLGVQAPEVSSSS